MTFNAATRAPRGRAHRPSTVAILMISAMTLFLLPGPVPAAAAEPSGKPVALTAHEKQAVAVARGGWWLARLAQSRVLHEMDPNAIPILVVGGAPGAGRFAVLVNHPAPPAGFVLAAEADASGPAAYLSRGFKSPPAGHVPVDVGGKPTALFVEGETVREGPDGAFMGDRSMTAVLHQMVHVHMADKGLSPSVVPANPPKLEATPMLLALTAVENRLLADALYTDPTKADEVKEIAKQFLAVRQARRALMGEAADYERRLELRESVPAATELEMIRMMGSRTAEPPASHGDDPTYASFKYALFQRVTLIFDTLVQIPQSARQILTRPYCTGPAQGLILSRLGYAWNDAAAKAATDLTGLIAEAVPQTPAEQASALERARKAYGFEGHLALFRENEAK